MGNSETKAIKNSETVGSSSGSFGDVFFGRNCKNMTGLSGAICNVQSHNPAIGLLTGGPKEVINRTADNLSIGAGKIFDTILGDYKWPIIIGAGAILIIIILK